MAALFENSWEREEENLRFKCIVTYANVATSPIISLRVYMSKKEVASQSQQL